MTKCSECGVPMSEIPLHDCPTHDAFWDDEREAARLEHGEDLDYLMFGEY